MYECALLLIKYSLSIVMQSYEIRIRQLMEELTTARKTLIEREESISKLRIEVQSSSRIVDAKVRDFNLEIKCVITESPS